MLSLNQAELKQIVCWHRVQGKVVFVAFVMIQICNNHVLFYMVKFKVILETLGSVLIREVSPFRRGLYVSL